VALTDRIATVFVSTVLALAAATALAWWFIDPERAFSVVLTVLVVTCPCALALATPAAFTVATSSLARQGFLVRRAGALHTLAKVKHVVFDKTGTLTDNQLEVADTKLYGPTDAATALNIAAALESQSAHPIAAAFKQATEPLPTDSVNNVAGCGLEGRVAERNYRIGTAVFAAGLSRTELPATDDNETRRQIWLGDEAGILACFTLSEELRPGAGALLRDLTRQGIHSSIASGDLPGPVAAIAAQLQAGSWQAGMLPEEKLQLVRKLQGDKEIVAVVGDGINDAPVLAGADVSIAMGSGTSMAQHSADCVWMGTELQGMGAVFALARRTMRIVKQNLVWALCYNVLAIPLAVSGSIAPWMAALGMSLSSLLVMLNALRLGRTSTNETSAAEPAQGCCKPAGLTA
jgi:Cu2+-exporting ATPase